MNMPEPDVEFIECFFFFLRKKMVLYMGRNNINSKLTDKG